MVDLLSPTFIFGALVGLTLVYAHWRVLWLENQAYSWKSVDGEIVQSDLGIHGGRYSSRSQFFYADIQYQYHVNGVLHTGNIMNLVHLAQLGAPQYSELARTAQNTLNAYPLGASVNVFYDPDQHSRAVLNHKAGWGTRINVLIGLLLMFLALYLIFFGS